MSLAAVNGYNSPVTRSSQRAKFGAGAISQGATRAALTQALRRPILPPPRQPVPSFRDRITVNNKNERGEAKINALVNLVAVGSLGWTFYSALAGFTNPIAWGLAALFGTIALYQALSPSTKQPPAAPSVAMSSAAVTRPAYKRFLTVDGGPVATIFRRTQSPVLRVILTFLFGGRHIDPQRLLAASKPTRAKSLTAPTAPPPAPSLTTLPEVTGTHILSAGTVGKLSSPNGKFMGAQSEDTGTGNPSTLLVQDNCLAVCSGLGGYTHGTRAAKLVIEAFDEAINSTNDLKLAVMAAQQKLLDTKMAEMTTFYTAFATIAAIRVKGNNLHYTHIGNLRIYVIRGDALFLLTRDHTLLPVHIKDQLNTTLSFPLTGETLEKYSTIEASIEPRHPFLAFQRMLGKDPFESPSVGRFELQLNDLVVVTTGRVKELKKITALFYGYLYLPGSLSSPFKGLLDYLIQRTAGSSNNTTLALYRHDAAAPAAPSADNTTVETTPAASSVAPSLSSAGTATQAAAFEQTPSVAPLVAQGKEVYTPPPAAPTVVTPSVPRAAVPSTEVTVEGLSSQNGSPAAGSRKTEKEITVDLGPEQKPITLFFTDAETAEVVTSPELDDLDLAGCEYTRAAQLTDALLERINPWIARVDAAVRLPLEFISKKLIAFFIKREEKAEAAREATVTEANERTRAARAAEERARAAEETQAAQVDEAAEVTINLDNFDTPLAFTLPAPIGSYTVQVSNDNGGRSYAYSTYPPINYSSFMEDGVRYANLPLLNSHRTNLETHLTAMWCALSAIGRRGQVINARLQQVTAMISATNASYDAQLAELEHIKALVNQHVTAVAQVFTDTERTIATETSSERQAGEIASAYSARMAAAGQRKQTLLTERTTKLEELEAALEQALTASTIHQRFNTKQILGLADETTATNYFNALDFALRTEKSDKLKEETSFNWGSKEQGQTVTGVLTTIKAQLQTERAQLRANLGQVIGHRRAALKDLQALQSAATEAQRQLAPLATLAAPVPPKPKARLRWA